MDPTKKITKCYSFNEPKKHPYPTCISISQREVTYTNTHLEKNKEFTNASGEYYLKFEIDEKPVNEKLDLYQKGTGDGTKSVTDSYLSRTEKEVITKAPLELQTDENLKSLDSNIKFFKTTVHGIFEKFYMHMEDYDKYKRKYHDILLKNEKDTVAMKEFIKEIIEHIMASAQSSKASTVESSKSQNELKTDETINKNNSKNSYDVILMNKNFENLQNVIESYKNNSYLTDSTIDDNSVRTKVTDNKNESFSVYFLNNDPQHIEIKMNERHMTSEINVSKHQTSLKSQIASAENIQVRTAKEEEMDNYVKDHIKGEMSERDIPIKGSNAKRNIHNKEDIMKNVEHQDNKSLMSKLCNFICKKIRRNALV